jgi:hypothetical protein
MSNNYWLNVILLEELVEKLVALYGKFIGIPYDSEDDLADDIQAVTDSFYQNNQEYLKFMNILQIRCAIATGTVDGHTVYVLDSFDILKMI